MLIFLEKYATVATTLFLIQTTIMAEQPQYVEGNIFVELGLTELPDEQKLTLLEQMNELIHKRTMLKVLEILTDEQKNHIMQQEGGSQEIMMKALQDAVPNLGELIFEQVQEVKNEMKASLLPEEQNNA